MARFWQPQVTFMAEGGAPEHFITLSVRAGVPLWDTSRRGITLFASCHAKNYKALRPVARRSGMRLRVCRRRGLPFVLRRIRSGVVVGLAAAVLLICCLSRGIWTITVRGNTTIPTHEILAVLEPLGVRLGGDFSAVSIPDVQLTALQAFPQLGWLTVNQTGCHLAVHVAEKDPVSPPQDTAPANIVATCDGVVVSVSTTRGQAMVKVGDAVTKGSLLISGVADSKVGPLLRRAEGSVLAQTTITLTARIPLCETKRVSVPVLHRPSLYVLGVTIPLYTDGTVTDADPVVRDYPLKAGEKVLPIGWQVVTYTAFREVSVTHTPTQAAALAAELLTAKEQETLANATVQSKTVREERTNEAVILTGEYVCVREIGEIQKIL